MWLRAVNLITGAAAVAAALALPGIFNILLLAYSFWAPLILVPLAAALLGVKSSGRAFRYALAAGLFGTTVWNYLLGKPLGIDGAVPGLLCNFSVFAYYTSRYQRHRVNRILVLKQK